MVAPKLAPATAEVADPDRRNRRRRAACSLGREEHGAVPPATAALKAFSRSGTRTAGVESDAQP